MSDYLIYEQPLNERIRNFLRLEKLFHKFNFHLKHGTVHDNPIAIDTINDILELTTTRSDIKLEVLKELERQHSRLERLSKRPQIDHGQLDIHLNKQKDLINNLKAINGKVGQDIIKNELLTAIRQKNSIPGVCDFDFPVFRYWLNQPEEQKRNQLNAWFKPFNILEHAISLILDAVRNSSDEINETAISGFFQKNIDTNQMVQLLRITVSKNENCFPEISAGKHRFSVRFLKNTDPTTRPDQSKEDIHFKLCMCSI